METSQVTQQREQRSSAYGGVSSTGAFRSGEVRAEL